MAEVGVTELRRHLRTYLDDVRAGEELIVTDRGTPIARILAVKAKPVIDRLVAEGRLSPPRGIPRPVAADHEGIAADGPVSDYVIAERDSAEA